MVAIVKPLLALVAAAALTVLAVVSIPWIMLAIGYGILDGDEAYRAMLDHSPVVRACDWWDAR